MKKQKVKNNKEQKNRAFKPLLEISVNQTL